MTNPILLLLVTVAAVAASKGDAEGPSPQGFTAEYRKFLDACSRRMTPQCAEEIVGGVYRNKTHLSRNCCTKLVASMGPDCQQALVEREMGRVKDRATRNKIVYRRKMAWRKCEKSVPLPHGRNYPRLPSPEFRPGYEDFLRNCSKKLSEKCGLELLDAMFRNVPLKRSCCHNLLKMGPLCYEQELKGLRNVAGNETELKEMKKKGEHIWRHCIH
ncbi:hypothetical protein M569_11285 [Genlisea aurea]|uniref:Prolamin-like domain-containing protein n=1 Tax=Genlisea aurea TaxID=192259 RepID=S8DUD6_9LAMI|nr:hypothetical protein M569_11285 [Genlisea aurea]